MIGVEQAIAAGYAAFKRKDFAGARQHLKGLAHPQAIHLLGLVEKGAGDYEAAGKYLARAAKRDPSNPEIANNQGLLARLTGDHVTAEAAFLRALKLKPDFHSARLSLGRSLGTLGRFEEAMAEFDRLLAMQGNTVSVRVAYANVALDAKDFPCARVHIDAALGMEPQNVSARYADGVLAFNLGDVNGARTVFEALLGAGEAVAEASYMMARVHLEQAEIARACEYAEVSFREKPANKNFLMLADTYWMSGNLSAFDALLEKATGDQALALSAVSLLRKAGRENEALATLDRLGKPLQNSLSGQSLRSALLLDIGDVSGSIRAGKKARDRFAAAEQNLNLVRALLVDGQVEKALQLIRAARKVDPLSQFWLGYEVTALRMLGDPQYSELIDYDRHVRTYELPIPDGFASVEAFNEAFLSALDQMNPFEMHPLNQSLRGGGQAPHDLCVSQNPVIKAYFSALDGPIRDYMQHLGQGDDHPSSARNTGDYEFSGAWSVRLKGGGHHVNHLHPRGWISSAYYVAVPPETGGDDSKAGWIKFGEPPIETSPMLMPEKWVQPSAGMLVLFPSFLWHGTEPIKDGAVRVTAPFDVVPK